MVNLDKSVPPPSLGAADAATEDTTAASAATTKDTVVTVDVAYGLNSNKHHVIKTKRLTTLRAPRAPRGSAGSARESRSGSGLAECCECHELTCAYFAGAGKSSQLLCTQHYQALVNHHRGRCGEKQKEHKEHKVLSVEHFAPFRNKMMSTVVARSSMRAAGNAQTLARMRAPRGRGGRGGEGAITDVARIRRITRRSTRRLIHFCQCVCWPRCARC